MDNATTTLRQSLCELIARRESVIRHYEWIIARYPPADAADVEANLAIERLRVARIRAAVAAWDAVQDDTPLDDEQCRWCDTPAFR